ncbi:hypothetical protein PM082_017801 [Marasmius tenuissimus]|nr:hypothetical protein PM082_017801 [Marasmius tenuissimus]
MAGERLQLSGWAEDTTEVLQQSPACSKDRATPTPTRLSPGSELRPLKSQARALSSARLSSELGLGFRAQGLSRLGPEPEPKLAKHYALSSATTPDLSYWKRPRIILEQLDGLMTEGQRVAIRAAEAQQGRSKDVEDQCLVATAIGEKSWVGAVHFFYEYVERRCVSVPYVKVQKLIV